MKSTILVIEDEPSIADNIVYALSTEGFIAHWRASGGEGKTVIEAGGIDLVILDVNLPDYSGFDLAKEIRQNHTVPIIFVTARSSEIDRVVGLEIGGDDYIVKPFSPRELTARVRAVLRRSAASPAQADSSDSSRQTLPFTIDEAMHVIRFRDIPLELSRYEYRLLCLLIRQPGRVYSRDQLMQQVWDEPDMSLERTVDTHIKTIRRKLRAIAPEEEWITTLRGIGYSLRIP
jgi:two-component system, OmpR family, catabolic regulation response regulator CreB